MDESVSALKAEFDREGYSVARGLFSTDGCAAYVHHYMTLRAGGTYSGDYGGEPRTATDPLKKYPRMIRMHEWDSVTEDWFLDSRLTQCLTALMGREPYALQTMLYLRTDSAAH